MQLAELLSQHTIPSAPQLTLRSRDGRVRCLACGHRCTIPLNRAGVCRVRFNRGGELRVPAGYVASLHVDPIEKKPFYHVLPGRTALSFGMLGCDLHCPYCQNWVTTQALRDRREIPRPHMIAPERLVELAIQQGAPVMVSTYNEPLISVEWAISIFKRAKVRGLMCGFVSNGNATPQVLEFIRPYVDLYKVDLKSFHPSHYRRLGGNLAHVLESIERIQRMGFWIEIVTLVVPGFNDNEQELRDTAQFIAGVSCDIPWHVTAFHPDYRMTDRPMTTSATVLRACAIGRETGLRYVYAGNLPGNQRAYSDTCCPECGTLLIERMGKCVRENRMKGPNCPQCGASVPGVFESSPPERRAALPSPVPAHESSKPCG